MSSVRYTLVTILSSVANIQRESKVFISNEVDAATTQIDEWLRGVSTLVTFDCLEKNNYYNLGENVYFGIDYGKSAVVCVEGIYCYNNCKELVKYNN